MDPEQLKKWKPLAYVLLAATVLSAVTGLAGFGGKIFSQLFPSPEFPVFTGFVYLDGRDGSEVFYEIESSGERFVFLSIHFESAGELRPAARFMDECYDFEIERDGGSYKLSTTIGGTVEPWDHHVEEYDVHCRTGYLTMELRKKPPQDVGTLGLSQHHVEGFFEVEIDYLRASPIHFVFKERSISAQEYEALARFASDQWEEWWEEND